MSELHQEKHPFLDFVKNNQKALTYAITLIVVVVVGYFGYTELYQNPREASIFRFCKKQSKNTFLRIVDSSYCDCWILWLHRVVPKP